MQVLWKLIKETQNKELGICFSGGADSLACALLFKRLKPTLYHFNHNLGEFDNAIQEQANNLAKELDLPFVTYKTTDSFTKGSTEDWCRKQRYKWLSQFDSTLITGHNLSESTESYLLNCLRGCPEYLPIPILTQFDKATVIRPLILTPKTEILSYIQKKGFAEKIVEDKLNLDLTRRRNWLRLELLPQIKEKTNLEKVVKKRYLKFLTNSKVSL